VSSDRKSQVLNIQHEGGLLSLTPDHMLLVDGKLRAARTVTNGASLSGYKVHAVTSTRSGIINPITTSGLILAASTSGQPILAATGNEWLADVMLSGYAKYSLSFNLAALFPGTVQAYYDAWLEAGFNAAVPTLAALKAAAPAPVVVAGVVAGDMLLAFGLLAFCTSSFKVLATLAAVAVLSKRYLKTK